MQNQDLLQRKHQPVIQRDSCPLDFRKAAQTVTFTMADTAVAGWHALTEPADLVLNVIII